jgi:elongation factor G
MFFNKLDRPGASFKASLLSLLSHRLHPKPMVLTLPIASFDPQDYARAEPGIQGLVDLINWEIWKWDDDTASLSQHPLPRNINDLDRMDFLPSSHPILPHLVPARTALLENLSMFSEELMESLLNLPPGPSSYLSMEASTIIPYLRVASLRNDILPVLCGSATKNIGTELVMNYIGELLAGPLDVALDAQCKDGPLRLLAWKVGWHPKKGWMTYVRVYSGLWYFGYLSCLNVTHCR